MNNKEVKKKGFEEQFTESVMSDNRAFVTRTLTQLIYEKFGAKEQYASPEVTIYDENGKNLGRVDYVIYKNLKTWKFYEVKSCEEDFYSDAKWTFLGHYNYFVFKEGLYEKVKDDIPDHVGVYEANSQMTTLKSVKRAKKIQLPIYEKLIYNRFIASLSRDAMKYIKIKDDDIAKTIRSQRNEINRLQADVRAKHSQLRDQEEKNRNLMILMQMEGYSRSEINDKLEKVYEMNEKRGLY